MPLIGIIAKKRDIKNISKAIKDNKLELIEINDNSIENLKNIKFDEIIVLEKSVFKTDKFKYINEIISKADYLIINDWENLREINIEKPIILITIGFNSKSTISISSINEDKIILSIQREIKKKNGHVIEVQEKVIEHLRAKNIYNEMIVFIISELHNC